ncbi:MAG: class I SAM-dependent methyltransferase [Rhodospirillaceae bacterium]
MQFSPHAPGAFALEEAPPASMTGAAIAAPPGTLERRYTLALALRALQPGAPLTAIAPKTKGGNRIAKELESFGCDVKATSGRHQRVCQSFRPATFNAEAQAALDAAIADGAPRLIEELGLWSQPGVFSWDRVDAGTALLLSALPAFAGRGADLGCGIGILARAVLASGDVTRLELLDIDRRAVAAARRNVDDARAQFHWADVRKLTDLKDLDFVVMNPPFHDGGLEDRALGETFVKQAYRMLRAGGRAWLVANVHLPYEAVMSFSFSKVDLRAEEGGYKVYEATK